MPFEVIGGWVHERKVDPGKFHPDSFRNVPSAKHRLVIGCPKGKYDGEVGRCTVGTKVQSIWHPRDEFATKCKKGRCLIDLSRFNRRR